MALKAGDEMMDCIVIGGGVSGLVAATRLAEAGKRVLVLEAGANLGGCVQSWRPEAGFWLELGAHTAYNSYGPMLEALDARGHLADLLQREKLGYEFVLADGRLQSPLRRLSFVDAALSLPFGVWRAKAGRTVAEWFGGLLGKRNYRRLLAPAFAAVLSQPADPFPAAWLFRRKPRMKAAPRKFTYAGGLQGLLEAIAADAPFEVRLQAPVQRVQRHDIGLDAGLAAGFAVEVAGETLLARQLVLATPVDVTGRLLSEIQPDAARILRSFPMSSSEALAVVVRKDASRLPAVAGLIGDEADFWSVVTRDPVPHEKYRGFTFHFRPGRLNREEKLACVAGVLGVSVADFLYVAEAVNRLPAPGVEHPQRVLELDALLEGQAVALVGNYLNGLSMGDCAERAAQVAERLLKK